MLWYIDTFRHITAETVSSIRPVYARALGVSIEGSKHSEECFTFVSVNVEKKETENIKICVQKLLFDQLLVSLQSLYS